MSQKRIVLVTGGFDPIHTGHIRYFQAAREFAESVGAAVWAGVNSDEWLIRKKGKAFLPRKDREIIISHFKSIDYVVLDWQDDDDTAIGAIEHVRNIYPDSHIYFVNGGDRTQTNIPEMSSGIPNVTYMFGFGGEKTDSSSEILKKWTNNETIQKKCKCSTHTKFDRRDDEGQESISFSIRK